MKTKFIKSIQGKARKVIIQQFAEGEHKGSFFFDIDGDFYNGEVLQDGIVMNLEMCIKGATNWSNDFPETDQEAKYWGNVATYSERFA